jgi:DNA-binding CsgD family transcriptional regulator
MQKVNKAKGIPTMAEVGLVLVDLSLKLIAYDRGAAAILNSHPLGLKPDASGFLPREILDILRGRKLTELSPVKTHFRMGKIEYMCRAYLVESYTGLTAEPMVALHLERVSSTSDAICEVGAKYNLTEREQEALRGISMGLTSKEVAERMNISPNTVKAFLRLIMIKMGVTTRGGIVANILNRASMEDAEPGPRTVPQRSDHEGGAVPMVPHPTPLERVPRAEARHPSLKSKGL